MKAEEVIAAVRFYAPEHAKEAQIDLMHDGRIIVRGHRSTEQAKEVIDAVLPNLPTWMHLVVET